MIKKKKIIALLPVKNESWILETYINNMSRVVDEIIILDDGSTDDSVAIANKNQQVKVFFAKEYISNSDCIDFSKRRQCLLELGRKASGTHFVWLDADETFSSHFTPIAREKILSLVPGEKIMMSWINLWKSTDKYIAGKSVWANSYKDFIVCDSPHHFFKQRFIHEDRTPGENNQVIKIPQEEGVVLHYNFVNWDKTQLKQAFYRCSELLEGKRSAKRINASYMYTLDDKRAIIKTVPPSWTENISLNALRKEGNTEDWRFIAILKLFESHGIEFFEPLEIWHIKELKNEFIQRTGREPKSQRYPFWLLLLNENKNKLKNLTTIV